jgi:hypothetical protein
LATRPRRRQFANQDNTAKVDAAIVQTDAPDEEKELCADWKLQIELAEERNSQWETRCKRIIKRYREDRPDEVNGGGGGAGTRRMNVLWSNVQTLQPSIYSRQPIPIAERRFLDRDVTGRVASQMLERAIRYEMEDCGFHDATEQCVLDYLLVGRGVAWLRYKPVIGQATSMEDHGDDELTDRAGMPPSNEEDDQPHYEEDEQALSNEPTDEIPHEKLLSASLEIDYIHWSDFLHSKARFWKENTWVARRLYPSRKDLIDDFGEVIGKDVPLEMTPEISRDVRGNQRVNQSPESLKKAIVYEIWDKATRKVYTIAKGYDRFLEEPREDPLNLEGFFPCPKPLFATMTNDTLEPVPDYIEYQDQAIEIDQLTNRIDLLIKALKVAGVYDASEKQLARLLDEGHENKLIPVPSWAAFAQKGGLTAAISFLPIKEVGDVLKGLFEARDKIKADMFEITGLSDIVRGQADPRETAEAVATKGRWGSLRLQARQTNVARFCRDIICMMGEIISEHFPEETLIVSSGAMFDEGIGGPEPVAPEPPKSPLIGHNGGPPMAGGPPSPVPQGQPGMVQESVPQPGMQRQPIPVGAQSGPIHEVPNAGIGGPQQIDPALQYAAQMQQYAQELQKHQMEKQALIQRAISLLRSDKLRGFRIDIETDSTIQSDASDDKQARTEFLTAVTGFIKEGFPIGQMTPEAVPMLGKMLLFAVRGFRAGRDLESTIEEFVDQVEKDAAEKAKMPPQPNPEAMKAQADLQATQAKSQAEIMKAKIDAQASAEDNQREMAAKQADQEIARQQMAMDMHRMQQEQEFRNMEFTQKMEEMRLKMEAAQRDHEYKLQEMHVAHTQHIEKLMAPKPIGGDAA